MSKTNDTSNLDHRELTETELDAVSGGVTVKQKVVEGGPGELR
jgi:bacteriocin-like protein